jgi:L-ascorbate metabolism protein UlaG (beta-lactamase superfamily)
VSLAFLDPGVIAEPLYDRFYASTVLVPPGTAAMQVVNGHLRILESFIGAPHIHRAAVRSPELRGGPFVDLAEDRVDAVRALHERTLARSHLQVEFVRALRGLCDRLQREARGMSLAAFYRDLPPVLAGLVELSYDFLNRPRLRLLESLMYRSPLYRQEAQSFAIRRLESDFRTFGASTPRLADETSLDLRQPFASSAVDRLFELQFQGGRFEEYVELCQVEGEDGRNLLRSFLTDRPARRSEPFQGDGVRLRYLGHASLLLETREVCLLVDPLLSYEYAGLGGVERFTFSDLPERIDYVLLSHNHIDHVNLETLIRLRRRIGQIVVPRSGGDTLLDPSLRLALQQCGFSRVIELDELGVVEVPGGRITGVPFFGEHGDHDIRTKIAHHIELGGHRVLCVTDSDNLSPEMYQRVHRVLGDVDSLFIGMECAGGPQSWLYGPLLVNRLDHLCDQGRRLNGPDCAKGLELVKVFSPSEVWVYAMAAEPWIRFISSVEYTSQSRPIVESDRFIDACHNLGIAGRRLYGKAEFSWG